MLTRSYQYPPLSSITDVRIFALEPSAEHEAPLRGKLINFSVEEIEAGAFGYEALSYVWGAQHDQVPLDCGDGCLNIPRNLSSALHHIRSLHVIRYVWADSISINQRDAPEKGLEVSRMYYIFSKARKVIMWLGKATAETKHSLDSLRKLCKAASAHTDDERYKKLTETAQYALKRGRMYTRDPLLMASQEPNWSSLAALFALPYFSRLWVLQEAVAPPSATLKLGHDEIDWRLVRSATPVLASKFYGLAYVFPAVSDNVDLNDSLRNFLLMGIGVKGLNMVRSGSSKGRNLFSVLLCTSTLSSTEPVDALFAIIHLAAGINVTDEENRDLRPDYRASQGEVFKRLATWLIVKHQQYDYLVFARAFLGEEPHRAFNRSGDARDEYQELLRKSDAPSWVPVRLNPTMNIGYFYRRTMSGGVSEIRKVRPAQAGNGPSASQKAELFSDGNVLSLVGKLADHVEVLSSQEIASFVLDEAPSPLLFDSDVILGDNVARYLKASLKETHGEKWLDALESAAFYNFVQYTVTLVGGPDTKPVAAINELSEEDRVKYGPQYVQYLKDVLKFSANPPKAFIEANREFESISRLIAKRPGKFCRTKSRRLGFVPWNTKEEDVICVINQVCVPFVVRPGDNGDTFIIVGECFIDSIMHGEALADDTILTKRIVLS